MRLAALVASVVALAQPAWALSCMSTNVATDYAYAAASDAAYIVVSGDLFFDMSKLPDTSKNRTSRMGTSTEIKGWLKGKSLTQDGFTKPFERDVTLRVSCLGPWCGTIAKGAHLTFLKQEGRSWVIEVSPCPSLTYADPTPDQESMLLACFRGQECIAN